MASRHLIQVAGVIDAAEAELLVAAGVTHLGFPLRLPDGREDLDEVSAAAVVARVGDRATCVLITYQTDAAAIAALARELGVGAIQLHGAITPLETRRLRAAVPDLFLIHALVVGAPSALPLSALARRMAADVDAFITDTWDPDTGRRGATGIAHDWRVTRELVVTLDRPVIVAGGLDARNVAAAVRATGAAGVDAHTGLEAADGRKDAALVRRFVDRARAALDAVHATGDAQ